MSKPATMSSVASRALMKITGMLRGGRMRLQAAAGFQAVDAGHDDVEQHQVGLDALGDVERALARGGDEGLVALRSIMVRSVPRLSGASSTMRMAGLGARGSAACWIGHAVACEAARWIVQNHTPCAP
jgi:hypothetical protein